MLKNLISPADLKLMKFQRKSVIDIDKDSESPKSCATDHEYMDELSTQYKKLKNHDTDNVINTYF